MAWEVTWEDLKSHVDRERAFLDWIETHYELASKAYETPAAKVPGNVLLDLTKVYRETGPQDPDPALAGTYRARWNCD